MFYGLTCVLGILNHYFIPHIKKEMPWLCFSQPLAKAKEWHAFEVTGLLFYFTIFFGGCDEAFFFSFSVPPKLSPLEKIQQGMLFMERNLLYPLTFLFAFGLTAHHYKAKFGDL